MQASTRTEHLLLCNLLMTGAVLLSIQNSHVLTALFIGAVIEGYSEEFESTFMEHLRRSHPFSRVMAKNVYNEYIADK